jgi:uncharacterized iron-regulated protein
MKLSHAQQHYLQIYYNEFRPNRIVNVDITNREPFTHLIKRSTTLSEVIYTERTIVEGHYMEISHTEFHEKRKSRVKFHLHT